MSPHCAAILLAGGRASRMGGIDKPGLTVEGVSLRDRAITAARSAGASPIVVVGPEVPTDAAQAVGASDAVRWAREDPPFSGPAAAVVTGLTALDDDPEWVLLLACDLARPEAAVERLLTGIRNLPATADGLCLTDAAGRTQWLTGLYRAAELREAAAAFGDGRDQPVRALLAGLSPTLLPAGDSARDVDTWEDYQQLTKERR